VASIATKFIAGWWAARRLGADPETRPVVGAALVPRGEFSIAIAGLAAGAGLEDDLGATTVTYVLLTVVVGAVATKMLSRRADRWEPADAAIRHG
jgi:monovalent cation:H+ antiporter-2, CPA2 family